MNYRWMTISEAARYFGKDVSRIRRWCYTGAIIEFGWLAYRDITGHWKVGVPTATLDTETVKTMNSVRYPVAI